MGIQDYFSTVADPRVVGRCKHKLSDILVIALASYLCGGEDYESMHELWLERGELLRPLVELLNETIARHFASFRLDVRLGVLHISLITNIFCV